MSLTRTIAPLLLAAACGAALAAPPPKAQLIDHSNGNLIDNATAKGILADGIPAKLWKVYPASKWAFTSQVEGGVTASGTCVVTANVTMLPLSPTLKVPLYRPEKRATAYEAQAGAGTDQCKELARAKLKQALEGVVSSLVKN